jgi:cobaltochelatase CobS
MDLLDLMGSMNLTSVEGVHLPVSKHCYGPVSQAFKFGYTLIMDEQNLLDPGVACALNEVVRGDTLLIEATGEVIHRHPMFRYAATSNDWGRGHGETRFAGTNDQNAAFLNRFWKFAAGYPTQETEVKIITSKVPAIPEQMASAMVKVANFIRPQISGVGDGGSLDFDFSTRTLLQWSDMTVRFTNPENPKPALYALEITLLNMLDNEEKEVVIRACKDCFGNEAF